jgi:hypothetical protein
MHVSDIADCVANAAFVYGLCEMKRNNLSKSYVIKYGGTVSIASVCYLDCLCTLCRCCAGLENRD